MNGCMLFFHTKTKFDIHCLLPRLTHVIGTLYLHGVETGVLVKPQGAAS